MAEIHHLEKSTWRHFFLPRVVRFWLISETGAEWHVDCAALRWCGRNQNQNVEFQYSGRLGEFNCMSSQSHLPHCRCKNSIRHIENRFSPYCILFFLMQFRLWRAAAFVSSPIHLLFMAHGVQTHVQTAKVEMCVALLRTLLRPIQQHTFKLIRSAA